MNLVLVKNARWAVTETEVLLFTGEGRTFSSVLCSQMQPGLQSYLAFPDLYNLFFIHQHFHISSSIISDRHIPATQKSPFFITQFSDSFAKTGVSHQQCLLAGRLYNVGGKLIWGKQNNMYDDLFGSLSHLI